MSTGRRIVVIDDDESLTLLITGMLRREGYDVRSAPDGARGLALVGEASPDLVILDFMLPAGGAPAVLEVLRSTSDGRDRPVLILSAIPEDTIAQKMRMDERTYFLAKPYGRAELLAKVGRILSESK